MASNAAAITCVGGSGSGRVLISDALATYTPAVPLPRRTFATLEAKTKSTAVSSTVRHRIVLVTCAQLSKSGFVLPGPSTPTASSNTSTSHASRNHLHCMSCATSALVCGKYTARAVSVAVNAPHPIVLDRTRRRGGVWSAPGAADNACPSCDGASWDICGACGEPAMSVEAEGVCRDRGWAAEKGGRRLRDMGTVCTRTNRWVHGL